MTTSVAEYKNDAEFRRLVNRESSVDLTIAALEIARDNNPDLDFRPTLEWISARAAELTRAVARARTEAEALQELCCCLSESWNLHGDADCYGRAETSYLNHVVETGRGLPISLSLIYMAVADRLGIALEGVAAPFHFITRLETDNGALFVDAFRRGRVMTLPECSAWVNSMGAKSHATETALMSPAGNRLIITRMLNNLKALFVRNNNWLSAMNVQQRLVALQPTSYRERRDLALICVRADYPGRAIDLLDRCLRKCPTEDRTLLQESLRDAERSLSRWN